jgi:predicted RNase H-like nuclease
VLSAHNPKTGERNRENATEHFFAWYTIGVEMMRAGEIVIAADTARFCKL